MANHQRKEEFIPGGAGGLKMFVRSWRPEGEAHAVVAIVHGENSHSGYYEWAGEQLAMRGLGAYAIDLHGRGRSEGERYYVRRMGDYVEDVDTLVQLVKVREPRLPVFLLGHGGGGVIAATYVLQRQAELSGFICESLAFELAGPPLLMGAMRGVSMFAPHLKIVRLKNEAFTRDPAVLKKMNEDPLIKGERQPSRTVAELGRADRRLRRDFAKIALPLLILHGTADKAARPHGSTTFFERAGSADKTLRLYEGRLHDLLGDYGREQVLGDIWEWIELRLSPWHRAAAAFGQRDARA